MATVVMSVFNASVNFTQNAVVTGTNMFKFPTNLFHC